MSKFLIHIHSGPDLKIINFRNVSGFGCFKQGNDVVIYCRCNVHLLKKKVRSSWSRNYDKNHLDILKENKIKLYVSGMSAKARGYDENLLNEFNAEFAKLTNL